MTLSSSASRFAQNVYFYIQTEITRADVVLENVFSFYE